MMFFLYSEKLLLFFILDVVFSRVLHICVSECYSNMLLQRQEDYNVMINMFSLDIYNISLNTGSEIFFELPV